MQALGGPGRPVTDTKQRSRGEVVIDGVTYTYVLYKRKPRWSLKFSPGYDGAHQGTASCKKGDEADAATICTRIREALERAAQRKTAAVTAATPTAPAQELSPMRTSTATPCGERTSALSGPWSVLPYISHTELRQGDLYLDWGGDFAEQPGPIMV